MVTATKQYFVDQIAATVSTALGLSVTVELRDDGQIIMTAQAEGPGAESPFWKAVREQMGDG